jgi:Tir chaperone protein (CesT) family
MNIAFPDWLQAWAQSHGVSLESARRSGRLTIPVDGVRILLSQHNAQRWLLQARVVDLPDDGPLRESLIDKAAATATARMSASASALAIDPDRSALWLQMSLNQDAGSAELEACLERMANDIEFWRAML